MELYVDEVKGTVHLQFKFSRTKRSNLDKFTSSLKISRISLNHYKMKMIPIVSMKAESSKKAPGEPETLTCVYVPSVYSWPT